MPSKKKKYNARFPPGRIKKIMQSDEEIGKVAQPVPIIISRILELYIEDLLTKTGQITSMRNAKTLSPSHMKLCVYSDCRFDFLKDLMKPYADPSATEDDSNRNVEDVKLDGNSLTHARTIQRSASATSRGRPSTSGARARKKDPEPDENSDTLSDTDPDTSLNSPIHTGQSQTNSPTPSIVSSPVITHPNFPIPPRQSVISSVSPPPLVAFNQTSAPEIWSGANLHHSDFQQSPLQPQITNPGPHQVTVTPTTPPPLVPISHHSVLDVQKGTEPGIVPIGANFYKDTSLCEANSGSSYQESQHMPHQTVIHGPRAVLQGNVNGGSPSTVSLYQTQGHTAAHNFIDEDYDT